MPEGDLCSRCSHRCFDESPDTRSTKELRFRSIDSVFNTYKLKYKVGEKSVSGPDWKAGDNLEFLVFVEGKSDANLWKRIGKPGKIGIEWIDLTEDGNDDRTPKEQTHAPPESGSGRFVKRLNKQVIECLFCRQNREKLKLTRLFDWFENNRAIGMVDWDFQYPLENSQYDPDEDIQYDTDEFYPLFRTETRDRETLVCKLKGLDSFLVKNIESDPEQVKKILLCQVTIPGFARWLNAHHKYKVNFNCLKKEKGKPECRKKDKDVNPFCDFIDETKELTSKNIVELLKNDNTGWNDFFKEFEDTCSHRETRFKDDLWLICQGHDILLILECMIGNGKIKLKHYPHRHPITEKEISKMLLDEFLDPKNLCYSQSKTIRKIIEWEKRHYPERFEKNNRGNLFISKVYREYFNTCTNI